MNFPRILRFMYIFKASITTQVVIGLMNGMSEDHSISITSRHLPVGGFRHEIAKLIFYHFSTAFLYIDLELERTLRDWADSSTFARHRKADTFKRAAMIRAFRAMRRRR